MNAETFVSRFERFKKGPRGFMVSCPAHPDRNPSLSVKDGERGLVLKCFGNCKTQDVVAAAGLKMSDLFNGQSACVKPLIAPEPKRIPQQELLALWDACTPVNQTQVNPHALDLDASRFLARRGLYPAHVASFDLARVLPLPGAYDWPAWWPKGRAYSHRLVTLAYDATGNPLSIHGRCTQEQSELPAKLWPRGVSSSGTVFADSAGIALLRGQTHDLRYILFAEGLTDFIAGRLSLWLEGADPSVTFGIHSGSISALKAISWPKEPHYIVATDADEAGERYAQSIIDALPSGSLKSRWRSEAK